MENIIGIISEYNPFHKGHKYLIDESLKRVTDAKIIALMSGNYTERGQVAIFNKYERAKSALLNGVSLVLELPVAYATSSAENFASAGVMLLYNAGITHLAFGAECDDLELLSAIARIINNYRESYFDKIKESLENGKNFAFAGYDALVDFIFTKETDDKDVSLIKGFELNTVKSVVSSPNNILAIEYLRAIERLNNKITPICIKRAFADYHSKNKEDINYSASALRNYILNNMSNQDLKPLTNDDFSKVLGTKLIETRDFSNIYGVSQDLSNKIINKSDSYKTFSDFGDVLKSKDLVKTAIDRALLHIMLDIKKSDVSSFPSITFVLGFKKDSSDLLAKVKENLEKNKIFCIVNYAKDLKSLNKNNSDTALAAKDEAKLNGRADSIYRMVYMSLYKEDIPTEYTRKTLVVR